MAKKKIKNEQETFMIAQDRKAMVNAFIHDDKYSPMKEKELAVFLQVEKEDRNELAQILEDLVNEGQIIRNNRGRYLKSDAGIIGVFTSNIPVASASSAVGHIFAVSQLSVTFVMTCC